jgi:hypothetical protein
VTLMTLSCSDFAIGFSCWVRHSGARAARTRNLEIPGVVLRTIPE